MTHWTLFGARERNAAIEAIEKAPDLYRVELREPKRSDAQNDYMWKIIDIVRAQKPDCFGPGLDKEDVKQVFVAGLFRELRMARNLEGDGYVPLTRRTSNLSWREMRDLLTVMEAWCARNGIVLGNEEKAA